MPSLWPWYWNKWTWLMVSPFSPRKRTIKSFFCVHWPMNTKKRFNGHFFLGENGLTINHVFHHLLQYQGQRDGMKTATPFPRESRYEWEFFSAEISVRVSFTATTLLAGVRNSPWRMDYLWNIFPKVLFKNKWRKKLRRDQLTEAHPESGC